MDDSPPSRIAGHGDGVIFSRGHASAPPNQCRAKVDKWISTSPPPPKQLNVGRVVKRRKLRPGAYTIKVHIVSGAELHGVDFGTHSCDPFVKICLSSFSGSVHVEVNTSTKTQTLDPVFNEVRIFHLPVLDTHAINDLTIRLQVRACPESPMCAALLHAARRQDIVSVIGMTFGWGVLVHRRRTTRTLCSARRTSAQSRCARPMCGRTRTTSCTGGGSSCSTRTASRRARYSSR